MDGTETACSEPAIAELRQYRTGTGHRDQLMALFEREFVHEQQRLGMEILGWYGEADDPDRFTWMRAFPDYATRGTSTDAFYRGDAWLRNREEANACLADSDDVLMLRPAWEEAALAPFVGTGSIADADLVIAEINPEDAAAALAKLQTSGAATYPGIGVYVTAQLPNNYPRLPIREDIFAIVTVIPGHPAASGQATRAVEACLRPWLSRKMETRRLLGPRSSAVSSETT